MMWRDFQDEIEEALQETWSPYRSLDSMRKALVKAIRTQQLDKVDRLLTMDGLDPNFRDKQGDFPLHVACSCSNGSNAHVSQQIMERLLFLGADTEVQDRFSRTPLHIAVSSSQLLTTLPLARLLLEKGCSVNAQDNAGSTALMLLCQFGDKDVLDMAQLLLTFNATLHLTNQKGHTALHCLCQNTVLSLAQRDRVAHLLLQSGLSANTSDREGRMAVCYEMDRLLGKTHRDMTPAELQLTQTLVCAGSNLRPRSKAHGYWLRFAANVVRPLMLLILLRQFAAVLTKPGLKLIKDSITAIENPALCKQYDSNEAQILKDEVYKQQRTVKCLQSLCRQSLRVYMKGKMFVAVPQLPLPNKLKDYLISLSPKPL